MRVAMAPAPALCNQHALIQLGEIVKHHAGRIVIDDSSHGNRDLEVFSIPAMTVTAFSMPSPSRLEVMIETKFKKCVFVTVGDQIDVAAITAVATAGTAARHKFLAAKGDGAMPAVSRFYCDFGFVNEQWLFHWLDRNESAGCAFVFELHDSGNFCEECVVFSNAYVQAGLELRASLPHENRTSRDKLAREAFYTEPLRMAVPAIARTSDSFFMSHRYPLHNDVIDSDSRVILPVTLRPAILFLAFLFENKNLLRPIVF
jgi:hypothetical protein